MAPCRRRPYPRRGCLSQISILKGTVTSCRVDNGSIVVARRHSQIFFTQSDASISVSRTMRPNLIVLRRSVFYLLTVLLSMVFANTSKADGPADFRIISGSESAVPVSVEAGTVIVEVTINGRGPFPLMFDTGAQNALTPEIAAALGLKTEGAGTVLDSGGDSLPVTFTRVKVIRVGDAEMTDQPFAVAALPPYLTDRGSRPALAGFLGYELLTRFAVRLDYDRRTLTLKAGSNFRYDGTGVRVPLVFTGKTPVVPAAADGIAGMFVVDTGSSGALTLRREFVEAHGLEARHAPAVRIKSIGV